MEPDGGRNPMKNMGFPTTGTLCAGCRLSATKPMARPNAARPGSGTAPAYLPAATPTVTSPRVHAMIHSRSHLDRDVSHLPQTDPEHRVLQFKPRGTLFTRRAPPPSPVQDLGKYERLPEEPDD